MSIAKVALLTILTWLLKAAKLAAARRGLDTGEASSVYLLYSYKSTLNKTFWYKRHLKAAKLAAAMCALDKGTVLMRLKRAFIAPL